jgi:rhodanese-related sulfurtransferase
MNQMPPQVDLDELEAALQSGHPLLDVREPDEFAEARVPQARLIPLMQVPDEVDSIAEFAGTGPLYVICAAGGRSNRAAAFLRAQGVDAINVMGGTNAWLQAGKPVNTGTATGSEPGFGTAGQS